MNEPLELNPKDMSGEPIQINPAALQSLLRWSEPAPLVSVTNLALSGPIQHFSGPYLQASLHERYPVLNPEGSPEPASLLSVTTPPLVTNPLFSHEPAPGPE